MGELRRPEVSTLLVHGGATAVTCTRSATAPQPVNLEHHEATGLHIRSLHSNTRRNRDST